MFLFLVFERDDVGIIYCLLFIDNEKILNKNKYTFILCGR